MTRMDVRDQPEPFISTELQVDNKQLGLDNKTSSIGLDTWNSNLDRLSAKSLDRMYVCALEGDESPALQNPAEKAAVRSAQQLGSAWDSAFFPDAKTAGTKTPEQIHAEQEKISSELEFAIQDAHKQGGMRAVDELWLKINSSINAPGAGPVFIKNGEQMEIHHGKQVKEGKEVPGQYSNPRLPQFGSFTDLPGSQTRSFQLEKQLEKPKPTFGPDADKNLSKLFPSVYSVAMAFKQAGILDDFLASAPKNSEQAYLLDSLREASKELDKIPLKMIKGIAGIGEPGRELVNKTLEAWGHPDAKLRNSLQPGDLAFAGMVSIAGSLDATQTELQSNGGTYKAANLRSGPNNIEMFQLDGHKPPVVRISNKDGIALYATKVTDNLTAYQQTELARHLIPQRDTPTIAGYDGVVVPFMDFKESGALPGFIGLSTDDITVSEARASKVFQLNHKEFKGSDAFAAAGSRGASSNAEKPYVFDEKILVFAVVDGTTQPFFVIHAGQESWKEPVIQK